MNPVEERRVYFLVSCEHASDFIPPACRADLSEVVKHAEAHRVHDVGARFVADEMASRLGVDATHGAVCRLAVDLNRSLGNPLQFSEPIMNGSELRKIELIEQYYIPFRKAIHREISDAIDQGFCVVHLSIHSFTKIFNGETREVDLGILYDPDRAEEEALGRSWIRLIKGILPDYCIRSNEPYAGTDDGHTTALRRAFSARDYIGIEVELSQSLELERDSELWAKMLVASLKKALLRRSAGSDLASR